MDDASPPLSKFLPPREQRHPLMALWGNKINQLTSSLLTILNLKALCREDPQPPCVPEQESRQLPSPKDKRAVMAQKKRAKIIPYTQINLQQQPSPTNPSTEIKCLENTSEKVSCLIPKSQGGKAKRQKRSENQFKQNNQPQKSKQFKESKKSQRDSVWEEEQVQTKTYQNSRTDRIIHQRENVILKNLAQMLPTIQKQYKTYQMMQYEKEVEVETQPQTLEQKLAVINKRLESSHRENKKKQKITQMKVDKGEIPQLNFSLEKILEIIKEDDKSNLQVNNQDNKQVPPMNIGSSLFSNFNNPLISGNPTEVVGENKQQEKKPSLGLGFGIPSLIPKNGSFVNRQNKPQNAPSSLFSKPPSPPRDPSSSNSPPGASSNSKQPQAPQASSQNPQSKPPSEKALESPLDPKHSSEKPLDLAPPQPKAPQPKAPESKATESKPLQPTPPPAIQNPFLMNTSPKKNLLAEVIGTFTGVNPLFGVNFQDKPLFPMPKLNEQVVSTPKKQSVVQNDQSSMFDESEHSARRDYTSSPHTIQQGTYSSGSLQQQSSFGGFGGFGNGFNQNSFGTTPFGQVGQTSGFFNMMMPPTVDLHKSVNMFGVQPQTPSLWGEEQNKKKQKSDRRKKKQTRIS